MSEKHERDIMREIQVALSDPATRLFRMQSGSYELIDGRHITVGFPGLSDLVGWHSVTITPEMVGRTVAIYTAIEVKSRRGKVTNQQLRFIEAVRNAGGLAGIARSIHEGRAITSLDPSTAKR